MRPAVSGEVHGRASTKGTSRLYKDLTVTNIWLLDALIEQSVGAGRQEIAEAENREDDRGVIQVTLATLDDKDRQVGVRIAQPGSNDTCRSAASEVLVCVARKMGTG